MYVHCAGSLILRLSSRNIIQSGDGNWQSVFGQAPPHLNCSESILNTACKQKLYSATLRKEFLTLESFPYRMDLNKLEFHTQFVDYQKKFADPSCAFPIAWSTLCPKNRSNPNNSHETVQNASAILHRWPNGNNLIPIQ